MKRIMLVEDDTWLASSYERVLSKQFDVVVALDAATALSAFEQGGFDAVVADIMLEGHTVLTLLHELQSYDDTARTPVVVCTSLGGDNAKLNILEPYGVKSVFDKALLTPEVLLRAVEEVTSEADSH